MTSDTSKTNKELTLFARAQLLAKKGYNKLRKNPLLMGIFLFKYLLTAIILIVVLVFQLFISDREEHPLQIMAFFENGWGGIYIDSYPSLQEHYGEIDIVSPFWYSINDEGRIPINRGRQEVIDFSVEHDIEIIPLVNNYYSANLGEKATGFLTDLNSIDSSIYNLINIMDNYPGINLDIEYISPDFSQPLSDYVKTLYSHMVAADKKLYLSLFPQVDFDQELAALHDYTQLPGHCHGIVLMAYDKHGPRTSPGPIAPITWVEENIEYALKFIEPEKLWLGIPVYGYRWEKDGSQAIPIPAWEGERLAHEYGITISWDSEAKAPYYNYMDYKDGNTEYIIWFENTESAKYKVDLARQYELVGIAIWRLGYEVEGFWENVQF